MKKNRNRKIIFLSLVLVLLFLMVLKIILPSYALDAHNESCIDDGTSTIKEAYIEADNGKINFSTNSLAKLSVTKEASKQYNVKVLLAFNDNKKEVDVILKEGVKWVEWSNEKTAPSTIKEIKSDDYITLDDYSDGKYVVESGKKTFVIKDDITCATLNFVISPDSALRVESIEDAITMIQKYDDNGIEKSNQLSMDVEVDYSNALLEVNGNSVNLKGSLLKGDLNYNTKARLIGLNTYNFFDTYFRNFEVVVNTSPGVTFASYSNVDGSNLKYWEVEENNNKFRFLITNRVLRSTSINPMWDFSETNVNDGEHIYVEVESIKYQLYNGKEVIHIFNSSSCVPEDSLLRQVICDNNSYIQDYTVVSRENIILAYEHEINDFNKKYPNEIIRLGSFNIRNDGVTSAEKIVNMRFDSSKIGVTQISLPAILDKNVRIREFKYKFEGDNNWNEFDESKFAAANVIYSNYSSTLGYVNFANEMVNSDKYITEVEYIIGKIPLNAFHMSYHSAFSYSGIIKKQSDGSYPNNYESTISIRNLDNSDYKFYNTRIKVKEKNYLSTCPYNLNQSKMYIVGEKMKFSYKFTQCNSGFLGLVSTNREPVIYVRLPRNLELNSENISISVNQYNSTAKFDTIPITSFTIDKTVNDENYNVYKISFEKDKNLHIGFPKYSQYFKVYSTLFMDFYVDIPLFYSDSGAIHYYNDMVFFTDASIEKENSDYEIADRMGLTGDIYDVNGDGDRKDLITYGLDDEKFYQIKTDSDINSYISIISNEEETDQIVIVKDTATVNAKIVNNSGIDNQKGLLFIPISRKGEVWGKLVYCDDTDNCIDNEYSLYLENLISDIKSDKYKIYYGKDVTPVEDYNNFININKWYSADELKNLSKEELKNINIIKIDVLDIDNGEELNIKFNLYTDEKNKDKIKYNYLSLAYYRDLKNAEGDVMSGWKKTNYINIGLGLLEEEIVTPITSRYVSIISIIISLLLIIAGLYIINYKVKNKKMD